MKMKVKFIMLALIYILNHSVEAKVADPSITSGDTESTALSVLGSEFLEAVDCFAVSYILGAHINDKYWLFAQLGLGDGIIKTSNKFIRKMQKSQSFNKQLTEKLVKIQLIKYDSQSKKIETDIAILIGSNFFSRYCRCQLDALA